MNAVMAALLFTDIEGSTRLWEADPAAMSAALRRHDWLVTECVAGQGGRIVKTSGDGVFAVFGDPVHAVCSAIAIQRAVLGTDWPTPDPLRLRAGVHLGVCEERGNDYFGEAVNRAARLHAIAHGGQIVVSGAAAGPLAEALPRDVWLEDLGDHRLKDLQRPERVFQVCAPQLPSGFPPLRSLSNPRMLHNLPQLASNMLGRDGDVTEVRGLIGSRRVVTLVGPGGVGKTRLALQAAAEVLDGAGDGVWWIDLASVDDESLVPAAVAAAVSVPHGPGRPPTETLAEALVDRRLLIVLDNCEHVIEGAAALAAALSERCAGLRILATSRETLRVPGEHVYAVRPLGRETAARLFQQRASERGVRITPADGRLVETVCEKLDGVPLALELAAARVRALGLTELVERLDRRFDLLHVGERTKPPRQRTLQSLIDWSYDLLSGEERRLLSSLSVFPGSFDLAAAEAVAGAAGIAGAHVLDSVASLVDKSLLVAEDASGTVRYRFLETIREYATGKLQESHLDAEIRRAHLTYFCALAEQLQPATRDARQPQALAQLQLEHHNLRGALSACLATGDAQTGLRIATALERFWMFRGLQEGGQWIHDLLALPGAARPPEALTQLSFAVLAHNPADALEIAQEALARAHQQANPAAIALATRVVGYGLELTGDAESAANAFTEAVAQARRCGDPHVLGVCLLAAAGWHNGRTSAASIASSTSAGTGPESEIPGGDFEALLSEARQSADRTGDTLLRIAVIGTFGYHQLASGNLAAARNELASALALASQLGSEMMIGNALVNNGLAAYLDGDRDEASRLFRRAVEPAIARHSVLETANAILGLALVLEDRDPQASAILHGAADARCASAGYQRDDLDERVSTASRMRLRTHLGEQRFAEAMKEGATLALASVIELADRVGVVVPPAPTPSHPTVD